MKKAVYIFVLYLLFFVVCIQAQSIKKYICFNISGLKTTLVYSDSFSIEEKDAEGIEKEINGDTISISVIDQRGQVPKGEIIIYTNDIHYLSIHNSELVTPDTIHTNNLVLELASSSGKLKISADSLSIDLGAASRLKVEGNANLFESSVGGFSHLDARKLISKKALVSSYGYSTLQYNAKEIQSEDVDEKSQLKNVYLIRE